MGEHDHETPRDSVPAVPDPRQESAPSGVKRRRFLTAAGAGAALASTAGCLGPLGGGGDGDGSSKKPLKVGAVFLLSGVAEFIGRASQAGARLGVQTVNEAGGIMGRDVEILFRDHENDAATAKQHIQTLVQQENVDVMIGLTSSGVTLNTAGTIAQLGVPFTLTDIGTPFITEFDEETYGDKAAGRKNIFRTNANMSINTYAIAKWATENLDVTRVANMGPDYEYGKQAWQYFKAYSKGLGADYKFVASKFPSTNASDMTPQINSILGANPDLVFTSFWGSDVVTFVKQAAEQGLFDQVEDVFDTLGADPTAYKALGQSLVEGLHHSSWYWHSGFKNKENKKFLDAYWKKYEDSDTIPIPAWSGPSTYSSIWLYKRAIENAGSTDPEKIINQLEGMEFTGPRGTWKIDPDSHQATAPTNIGETVFPDAEGNDGYGPGVPYEGGGLKNVESTRLDRKTASNLLEGSGLPPGV